MANLRLGYVLFRGTIERSDPCHFCGCVAPPPASAAVIEGKRVLASYIKATAQEHACVYGRAFVPRCAECERRHDQILTPNQGLLLVVFLTVGLLAHLALPPQVIDSTVIRWVVLFLLACGGPVVVGWVRARVLARIHTPSGHHLPWDIEATKAVRALRAQVFDHEVELLETWTPTTALSSVVISANSVAPHCAETFGPVEGTQLVAAAQLEAIYEPSEFDDSRFWSLVDEPAPPPSGQEPRVYTFDVPALRTSDLLG